MVSHCQQRKLSVRQQVTAVINTARLVLLDNFCVLCRSYVSVSELENRMSSSWNSYDQYEVAIPLTKIGDCMKALNQELYGPTQRWKGFRVPTLLRFIKGKCLLLAGIIDLSRWIMLADLETQVSCLCRHAELLLLHMKALVMYRTCIPLRIGCHVLKDYLCIAEVPCWLAASLLIHTHCRCSAAASDPS